jgi:hypothetical protein
MPRSDHLTATVVSAAAGAAVGSVLLAIVFWLLSKCSFLPSFKSAWLDMNEVGVKRCKAEEAKKLIYRGVAHAGLVWGVDREKAIHNPVFWLDDALHYCSPLSNDDELFDFLSERGIMTISSRGVYRLNHTFEKLDEALDHDFSRGIDFEMVVGLLFSQLLDRWAFLNLPGPDAGPTFLNSTEKFETEVIMIFVALADLGYLQQVISRSSRPQFRWTRQAASLMKEFTYSEITF